MSRKLSPQQSALLASAAAGSLVKADNGQIIDRASYRVFSPRTFVSLSGLVVWGVGKKAALTKAGKQHTRYNETYYGGRWNWQIKLENGVFNAAHDSGTKITGFSSRGKLVSAIEYVDSLPLVNGQKVIHSNAWEDYFLLELHTSENASWKSLWVASTRREAHFGESNDIRFAYKLENQMHWQGYVPEKLAAQKIQRGMMLNDADYLYAEMIGVQIPERSEA